MVIKVARASPVAIGRERVPELAPTLIGLAERGAPTSGGPPAQGGAHEAARGVRGLRAALEHGLVEAPTGGCGSG